MRKLLIFTLILAAVLTISGAALAQDDYEFCGSLSEADCALFNSMGEAALPGSTAFTALLDQEVTVPGEEPLAFQVALSGAYVLDREGLDANYEAFANIGVLDFNLRDFFETFDTSLEAFDAELLIDLTIGDPMADNIDVQLWLVDGVGYVDLTPLEAMDPSLTGVVGMDIVDSLLFGLEQVSIGDLMALAEASDDMMMMGGGDEVSEAFAQGFSSGFQNQPDVSDEEGIAFVEAILDVSRAEDAVIDGTDVAVFTLDIDLAELFASEVFLEGTRLNLPDDAGISAEEFQQVMIDGVAQDSTISVNYSIEPESGTLYGLEVMTDLSIDAAVFAEAFGEEMGEEDGMITVSQTMTFERSNVNGVEAITLPEGASTVNIQELMMMMGGGM